MNPRAPAIIVPVAIALVNLTSAVVGGPEVDIYGLIFVMAGVHLLLRPGMSRVVMAIACVLIGVGALFYADVIGMVTQNGFPIGIHFNAIIGGG
jgi:hypothetical protein